MMLRDRQVKVIVKADNQKSELPVDMGECIQHLGLGQFRVHPAAFDGEHAVIDHMLAQQLCRYAPPDLIRRPIDAHCRPVDKGVPCISRDGSMIVFRHLFDLYRFRPGSAEGPQKIDIECAADRVPERKERRVLTTASQDFDSAYQVCGALAELYPEQAGAIGAIVRDARPSA